MSGCQLWWLFFPPFFISFSHVHVAMTWNSAWNTVGTVPFAMLREQPNPTLFLYFSVIHQGNIRLFRKQTWDFFIPHMISIWNILYLLLKNFWVGMISEISSYTSSMIRNLPGIPPLLIYFWWTSLTSNALSRNFLDNGTFSVLLGFIVKLISCHHLKVMFMWFCKSSTMVWKCFPLIIFYDLISITLNFCTLNLA